MGIIQVLIFAFCALLAHNAHGACYLGGGYVISANSQEDCMSNCQAKLQQSGGNCGGDGYSGVGYCTWNWGCIGHAYCGCSTCQAKELECTRQGGIWHANECSCEICTDPDTTFTESSCAYDPQQGKYMNIVNTVTRTNCVVTVRENKYYSLTCDTTCNNNSELTCMGSVDGVTVFLRSCNGRVSRCEADGSCEMAIRKVANGECENPNDPPTPNSSGDAGSSSSESGNSSGGTGEDWEWLKDSLHAIRVTNRDSLGAINHNLENMQPFVAGTYDQVTDMAGTAHDINSNILTSLDFLNDINKNTGNTANNTNNINNKLTSTNQLLADLNNKNWDVTVRPEITVQGDTNIVNVTTDTAKSGAAILDYLKGIFGHMDTTNNYNPSDTTGSGHAIDSVLGRIEGIVNDSSYLAYGDSVGNAVTSMKGSYNAIKDTLAHSAISDSLNRWGQALTNNGTITGNGSDNCPSILERDWELNFGLGVTVTAGHLGRYICTPIGGLSITIWALCRVLLRAIVAIGCMLWLYKAVLGIDGGSNDED